MREPPAPPLTFEGVIGYAVSEPEEAVHFFEHTLGLQLAAADGPLRMYALGESLTIAVDVTGASAGEAPYLLFSTPDLTAAAEHFLERGCNVKELPWATGSGFLARTPEGHTVCVVDEEAMGGPDSPSSA
jgi:predicted enzyme related to lactoylglutathione lyase